MSLYDTGVRPIIDEYLKKKSEEVRNYGEYWSASSAGYCMRKTIFEKLGVPPVKKDSDERRTRIFEAGHAFHRWYQEITKAAGISIAQEMELQDEELKIRGHFDDLVLIDGKLILYDVKTAHSRSFHYAKGRPMSHYHRMQLGTYMYMIRNNDIAFPSGNPPPDAAVGGKNLTEARRLAISKDDLCMNEVQLMWSDELHTDVVRYWTDLNTYWTAKKIPSCTCADYEGGFMSSPKYNPYYYNGSPCSIDWYEEFKKNNLLKETDNV